MTIKPSRRSFVLRLLGAIAGIAGLGLLAFWRRIRAASGKSDSRVAEVFPDPRVQALIKAAQQGAQQRVKEILKTGIDIDTRGQLGMTPLLWVTVQRDARAVETLLQAGANPDLKDAEGHPPLQWAVRYPQPEIRQSLLSHGANPNITTHLGEPVLLVAIDQNSRAAADALLAAGANIDATSRSGETAAMRLASFNQFGWAADMIERGADPFKTDATGASIALYLQETQMAYDPQRNEEKNRLRTLLQARGIRFPVPRPWEKKEPRD